MGNIKKFKKEAFSPEGLIDPDLPYFFDTE